MCEMCDGGYRTGADLRARVVRTIENFGWLVQFVEADERWPSLAYTVGLTASEVPEVYVVGMGPQAAGGLLNHVAELCIAGQAGRGSRIAGPDGREYVLADGSPEGLYVALEVYGSSVRAMLLRAV
ncbi:MAG: DUF4262 domain-containing protein [Candidatus Nanopelagicales bacterium]